MNVQKIDRYRYLIPKSGKMLTTGLLYASEKILPQILAEKAADQCSNVACLPGIVGPSLAMPDAHWGYGFPIGGVAAFDAEEGVVSPGGVGYDINCGVRLIATNLLAEEVRGQIERLAASLFAAIPSGVGARGDIRLTKKEAAEVMEGGSHWARKRGLATDADVEATECGGRLAVTTLGGLSDRAWERALDQLGTLGSGNHFLELQRVETIFDAAKADAFGLFPGQLVVMLHSGSRGFGYQVCDDFLKTFARAAAREHIELPDRQLACARLGTREADEYLASMNAAANYAFANRQAMASKIADGFARHFGKSAQALGIRLVYDVSHNIARYEAHTFEGRERLLLVHRKGATRAFGPGHPDVPARYRAHGQPVLIPGDMGRASYVLAGTKRAMEETFGSTCHGAGRVMSRTAALKAKSGRQVFDEQAARGVRVFTAGLKGLAEEMPEAYKDVEEVVEAVGGAGISERVARLKPIAVIKG